MRLASHNTPSYSAFLGKVKDCLLLRGIKLQHLTKSFAEFW